MDGHFNRLTHSLCTENAEFDPHIYATRSSHLMNINGQGPMDISGLPYLALKHRWPAAKTNSCLGPQLVLDLPASS